MAFRPCTYDTTASDAGEASLANRTVSNMVVTLPCYRDPGVGEHVDIARASIDRLEGVSAERG